MAKKIVLSTEVVERKKGGAEVIAVNLSDHALEGLSTNGAEIEGAAEIAGAVQEMRAMVDRIAKFVGNRGYQWEEGTPECLLLDAARLLTGVAIGLEAAAPMLELATAVVVALREFEAVQVEIDAAHAEGACVPMSELAIGLGGRSIDAWKRVEEALKAVKL